VVLAVIAGLVATAVLSGYLLFGIGAIVGVLGWLAIVLRVTRLAPAGPRGDGPAPPGGAGVREPRRPLPHAPAGAAAIAQYDDDEPPWHAVANG
jgi:hypothetical protein